MDDEQQLNYGIKEPFHKGDVITGGGYPDHVKVVDSVSLDIGSYGPQVVVNFFVLDYPEKGQYHWCSTLAQGVTKTGRRGNLIFRFEEICPPDTKKA